jgi:hypothetical protein
LNDALDTCVGNKLTAENEDDIETIFGALLGHAFVVHKLGHESLPENILSCIYAARRVLGARRKQSSRLLQCIDLYQQVNENAVAACKNGRDFECIHAVISIDGYKPFIAMESTLKELRAEFAAKTAGDSIWFDSDTADRLSTFIKDTSDLCTDVWKARRNASVDNIKVARDIGMKFIHFESTGGGWAAGAAFKKLEDVYKVAGSTICTLDPGELKSAISILDKALARGPIASLQIHDLQIDVKKAAPLNQGV